MQASSAATIREILMDENFGDETPVYGHVSLARAGERDYIWFLGWTPHGDGAIVIALVLEFDPGEGLSPQAALDVAIPALEGAHSVVVAR
jgi:hypothetical protein